MPRLVVVSNRVAVPDPEGPRQAGGLAVAVNAALKRREGLWFGWSGATCADDIAYKPKVIERRRRSFVTIDLSHTDYQEYYNGFANRVLWPILHYRVDLAEFTAVELSGYLRVNSRFADALSGFIRPDDWIWVHDYHLLPLAKELRARGHDNPIGFFLHIPCPPSDILLALPQHADTMGALAHYDLVGTQTEHDAENLRQYFEQQGASFGRNRTSFDFDGRRVLLRAFPVAIATGVYARAARNAIRSDFAAEVRESLNGRKLILGVDRLDYSKGIPQRIQGFGQFLDSYPQWRHHVTYLQVTPTSRSEVPEYADINQTVNELVGQINGRYGEPAWTPIRYVNRAYSRASLAALYRMAAVGLVTPLRDGMNLVAKEYVAAQDPENPGVLVLSQFAGAAEELDGAVVVNPLESEAMAAAIDQALHMPLPERQARYRRMYRHLAANDIDRWAERFLSALAESRQQPRLFDNLRQLFAARASLFF
ncbi:MAG: alpha,alpha-trehalose-phosphate synthase (UDP-forming) [Alphaproteobacteria bacterium]|nr:alpha,alpha-trehalose-phosphate synthase (UDP-forming) [Alphaproteobacteria bacterium]